MNATKQMMLAAIVFAAVAGTLAGAADSKLSGDRVATDDGNLVIHPLQHATFLMQHGGNTIYVDPVGGGKAFAGLPHPDLILITDIHGDHLNAETVAAVRTSDTTIVAPAAVAEKLSDELQSATTVLANGKRVKLMGITIEAIPMYNLTPERKRFHTKGRGNGYVLTLGGKRVYISGDTEDIPEMRKLMGIDVAFVCMNLPYTMDVEHAASAVREFKPKIVYPFHYRGGGGTKSDVNQFKRLVGAGTDVEVRLLKWYP